MTGTKKKQILEENGTVSSLKDDTYLPENDAKFAGDMTTWFNVDYGHIFVYFLKALQYRYKNSCYHGTT